MSRPSVFRNILQTDKGFLVVLSRGETRVGSDTRTRNSIHTDMIYRAEEAHKWANVTRIDNQWFRTNPSIHISCDVNALDLVTLGASFLKSREMFVHAKAGRKVELKEYAKYALLN